MKIGIIAVSLTGCLALASSNIFAQNYEDVLRNSELSTGTTARSMAIGGAAGSLGADFSAASVNPAGLGIYRQSEFSITPYLSFNGTKGTYLGATEQDNNTAFKLGNIGLVFNTTRPKLSGWKGVTFAIGVNKLADFNNQTVVQGINSTSTYADVMSYNAQQYGHTEQDDPLAFLGYQGYILKNDLTSIPYSNVIATGGSVKQTQYQKSKGAVNEYTLSLAGNYNDKLFLGATVGITSYRYKRTADFVEADNTGNTNNDFSSFTVREKLETTGAGVNGKFGFIYAPSKLFRFGASIHTPTAASMTDYVDYNIVSKMEGLGNFDVSPQNLYQSDYTIVTPMRAIVSATGFFGTRGFITGDVEYVPYNTMRIHYSGNDVATEDASRAQNDYIRQNFKGVINGRLGLEFRATNELSLRGGAAFYGNSYASGVNDMGGDRLDLSLGLGFKLGSNSTLDLTYLNSNRNYKQLPYYDPYPSVASYVADYKNNRNLVALTLTSKF